MRKGLVYKTFDKGNSETQRMHSVTDLACNCFEMSPAGSKRSGKTRMHTCTERQRRRSEMIHTQADPASISGVTPSQQLQMCYSHCVGGFASLLAFQQVQLWPEGTTSQKIAIGRHLISRFPQGDVTSSQAKTDRDRELDLPLPGPQHTCKCRPLKHRSPAWPIKSLQNKVEV